jgi:WD40 repeat protein
LGRWVDFWSVPEFKLIRRLESADTHVTSVAFSPDSSHAYLSRADQTIAVYDVATLNQVDTLHGHRDEVWCVAASPDGTQVASGSRDGTVRIWSTAVQAGALAHRSLPPGTREVYLAEDGQTLATIPTNQRVQVWRTADFQCLVEGPVPYTHRQNYSNNHWTQVALAPEGTLLAISNGNTTGGGDVGARLTTFDVPSLHEGVEFRGLRSWAAGLAFSPDGTQLAATGLLQAIRRRSHPGQGSDSAVSVRFRALLAAGITAARRSPSPLGFGSSCALPGKRRPAIGTDCERHSGQFYLLSDPRDCNGPA